MITLPKAITFDCYGTLIDWERGIQRFFAESMDSKDLAMLTHKPYKRNGKKSNSATSRKNIAPTARSSVTH